jgi:hypothetical protein
LFSLAFFLILGVSLAGCSNPSPNDSNAPNEPGQSSTPQKPPPKPEQDLVFVPDGSASENLLVFQRLLELSGAGTEGFRLNDAISSLVEAGFSLDSMTHTNVLTGVREPADSVSLAVSLNGECLIGQFSKSWLKTAVAKPTLSGCLIGDFETAKLEN